MSDTEKTFFNVEKNESHKNSLFAPAIELLYSLDDAESPWSPEVRNNPEVRASVLERKKLLSSFKEISETISSTAIDINEAQEKGLVDDESLVSFYNQISNFIENEDGGERIVLYFPFEFIPTVNSDSQKMEVSIAEKKFRKTFMEAWRKLLTIHDVRENFISGDIPEQEIRKTPLNRVCKAAHLIPFLIQKEMISLEEVIEILEKSNDSVLKNSIADALTVVGDLNLIGPEILENMRNSNDSLLNNISIIIEADKSIRKEEQDVEQEKFDSKWLAKKSTEMSEELKKTIDEKDVSRKDFPESRIKWENSVLEKKIIEQYSEMISRGLLSGELSLSDIQEALKDQRDVIFIRACILGIEKTLIVGSEKSDASNKIEKSAFVNLINELWTNPDQFLREDIIGVLSRLKVSKVLEQSDLDLFGIKVPKFDELVQFENSDIARSLSALVEKIKSNEVLSKFVLPIVIIGGSKIKGYGTNRSDTDSAVFIKPGTPLEKRTEISEQINKVFSSEKNIGTPVEFWLKEKEGTIKIMNFSEDDVYLGDDSLTYVIFGGVWGGDSKLVRALYEKLLSGYLKENESRKSWLEQFEHDALQYRLMHKGYRHFYPTKNNIDSDHSDEIDGDSAFWDSGYRRVATMLYIKKVFLPKLG